MDDNDFDFETDYYTDTGENWAYTADGMRYDLDRTRTQLNGEIAERSLKAPRASFMAVFAPAIVRIVEGEMRVNEFMCDGPRHALAYLPKTLTHTVRDLYKNPNAHGRELLPNAERVDYMCERARGFSDAYELARSDLSGHDRIEAQAALIESNPAVDKSLIDDATRLHEDGTCIYLKAAQRSLQGFRDQAAAEREGRYVLRDEPTAPASRLTITRKSNQRVQ